MKTSNRAGNHAGKTRRSAQSAKATKAASANAAQKVDKTPEAIADITDHVQRSVYAVYCILEDSKQPLSEQAISELLRQRKFIGTPEQVRQVLALFESFGLVSYRGGWEACFLEASAVFQTLNALLPANQMEQAFQRVKAVLALLRCKLISDFDGADHPYNPAFDEVGTQQLCGLLNLIGDADKSFNAAYLAATKFTKEFRRLSKMAV